MDRIDRQLIALLQDDARLGYQELGDAVGLSAAAVFQRVRKLEQAGVLTGYRAEVAAESLGWSTVGFLRVVPGPATDRARLLESWRASGACQECHLLTGEVGFLVKLRLQAPSDLESHVETARRLGCRVTAELALATVLEQRRVPAF
jgi:Lrp/AsnC family leucine-responsive transcriptional regulator